jgi:hypothetical protein
MLDWAARRGVCRVHAMAGALMNMDTPPLDEAVRHVFLS